MNVLVFGLGALGSVYSCLLKKAGHRVVGLAREASAEKIRTQGLKVTGIWGDHTAFLDEVVSTPEDVADQCFDLIILTVKSFDTGKTARQIAGLVGPKTLVLLAQNGFGNYEAAAEFIPETNLALGRVIFGAETLDIGVSKVTVIADDVVLGSPKNLIDQAVLDQIAQACSRAGIPTRTSSEVLEYIWGKIIYNSALNTLGAIFEVPYGKLAANNSSKQLMDKIIEEIFALLNAMGQKTLWPDSSAYLKAFYGQLVPSTASHHASMLQDIQRGRKTEIDALNGAVVNLAGQFGVPTPVNQVIVEMVRAKERFAMDAV